MEGSKTRPGFSGGDEIPPSKTEGEASPRLARTIIGRALHLRPPPKPLAAATARPSQREAAIAGVPEPVTDEVTEKVDPRPGHSGKSKFPAFARIFGRWTTGGGFLSRSRMSRLADDPLDVPRETWVSRVVIFVVAAILSFLVVLLVLKIHRCGPAVSPPAAKQALVSPDPPTPSAGAAPTVVLAPAARPDQPAAAPLPPPAAAPVVGAGQPPAVRRKTAHRPSAQPARSDARTPRRADSYPETLMPLQL